MKNSCVIDNSESTVESFACVDGEDGGDGLLLFFLFLVIIKISSVKVTDLLGKKGVVLSFFLFRFERRLHSTMSCLRLIMSHFSCKKYL